jgi:hypothetical protein
VPCYCLKKILPTLRRDPATLFQALLSGIESTMLDEEFFLRCLLDGASDALAVLPTKRKGVEDEQIQSALEQFETFNAFLGRHPTREYVHAWVGCQPKMESEIRGRSPPSVG